MTMDGDEGSDSLNRPEERICFMGEQQSKKRGVRSAAQKEARARDAYAELPASNRVYGAFGKTKPNKTSDEDVSLTMDERRTKRERNEKK